MAIPLFRASGGEPRKRLADALAGLGGTRRGAAGLIVAYAALWWAYAVIAKSTQDIHFDMGEVFAWSLDLAYGYPKHPPFQGWVAAAWFALFPRADWAFYLLSATSLGIALWFVWLIAARVVTGEKRTLALVLLAFAPTFNFLSLKFNSNALLIPVWAGATWLFLRSYAERTFVAGALAGVGAAVAMLTKYWSIFLIIGFAAGVLADPRRGAYLRSSAPWASVAAGAILIAPNIASLFAYDFQPFKYAAESHADASFLAVVGTLANYLAGALYLAGGFVALALAATPNAATWRDMLWPAQSDRRFMAVIMWSSLLAPIAIALALQMRLNALWTMPHWALLPALVLSAPGLIVTRRGAGMTLVAAYALPCVALAASPFVALWIVQRGVDNSAAFYSLLAHEVDRRWPQVADEPLRYVAGSDGLAWGCSFYCRDRPRAFPSFSRTNAPWIDPAAMVREGFVGLCVEADQRCVVQVRAFVADNPTARADTVELSRSLFGTRGESQRFTIFLAPPRP